MTRFVPGSRALIRGSFEEVEIIAAHGSNVLVKRGSGQAAYSAEQLEPYDPDYCPIN